MNGPTHMMGGAVCALAYTTVTSTYIITKKEDILPFTLFMGAAITGALIPDIDHKRSKVSNKNKVLSFFVRLFFEHRGFTHSPLFALMVALVLTSISKIYSFPYSFPIILGITIGIVSHIFLDMINPKGVPLLFPIRQKFGIGLVKTGHISEIFFKLALAGCFFYFFYRSTNTYIDYTPALGELRKLLM